MAETVQSYPGLYPLGSDIGQTLLDGNVLSSDPLNTRDIYSPGAADYVLLGPGSQVWFLCYSVLVTATAPADRLGLVLELTGSYDTAAPFTFATEQSLILPVYAASTHHYAGRARAESPVAELRLINNTGETLTVSFQFWGKAL